ncbi:MAG: DUF6578 domain-containing protein [Pseudonocardiaceae bacterium]
MPPSFPPRSLTIHGIVPADFPRTTGRVNRLRLVTQHYAKLAERSWQPVPGTVTLTDIQRSPRWFTDAPPAPLADRTAPQSRVFQTGVLLDLAVPESPE